jgi:peroxidase
MPGDNETTTDCTLSKALTGIDPPPEVKCFKAGETNTTFSQKLLEFFKMKMK